MSKSHPAPLEARRTRSARAPEPQPSRGRGRRAHAAALGRRRSRRAKVCSARPTGWRAHTRSSSPATTSIPYAFLKRTFEEIDGYDETDRAARHPLRDPTASITWRRSSAAPISAISRTSAWSASASWRACSRPTPRRLQIQEKLTAQVANTIQEVLQPRGRRRRCRRRAPVHDHARRAQAGNEYGDEPHARQLSAPIPRLGASFSPSSAAPRPRSCRTCEVRHGSDAPRSHPPSRRCSTRCRPTPIWR